MASIMAGWKRFSFAMCPVTCPPHVNLEISVVFVADKADIGILRGVRHAFRWKLLGLARKSRVHTRGPDETFSCCWGTSADSSRAAAARTRNKNAIDCE
jgi:hypothetical protein